jgi:hypothetical protein
MVTAICSALPLEPGQAERLLLFSRFDTEQALNAYCEAEALVRQQAGLPPPPGGPQVGCAVVAVALPHAACAHSPQINPTPDVKSTENCGVCGDELTPDSGAQHRLVHRKDLRLMCSPGSALRARVLQELLEPAHQGGEQRAQPAQLPVHGASQVLGRHHPRGSHRGRRGRRRAQELPARSDQQLRGGRPCCQLVLCCTRTRSPPANSLPRAGAATSAATPWSFGGPRWAVTQARLATMERSPAPRCAPYSQACGERG